MHRGKFMWKKAAAMLLGTLFMAVSPAVPAQVDVSPFVERDSFNDIKI